MGKIKKILSVVVAIAALATTFDLSFITLKAQAANAVVNYQTHVQDYGWQGVVSNGAVSGTSGEGKRLEAISISVDGVGDLGVAYQAHVENYGWMDWVGGGNISGTQGQSLRLEAIRIQLTGGQAGNYDIWYRVHVQDGGWLGWVANGDTAGTSGMSKRLEAIQISVVPKGSGVPASLYYSYDGGKPALNYKTHVQNYGWMSNVVNGNVSGTSGQSLRLEGITLEMVKAPVSGGITYRTHVQDYGWMNWVSNGQLSGTTGEAKRLEAIQIKLTGELANLYDVYYRVHIQNYGWLDWAKNGAIAGSSGMSLRLEAIQVQYVGKGCPPPGNTGNSYISSSGIDVSKWQGSINWNQVASSGISFAMVRFFDRSTNAVDAYFLNNVRQAQAAGVKVGVYEFATARNTAEAEAEAWTLVNNLRNNNISLQYPVAYDVESDAYQGGLSPSEVTDIILAFKNVIESNGYHFMLYANLYWLNYRIDMSRLQDAYLWVARYTDVSNGCGYDSPNVVMWQHSSEGSIAGIAGNVDLDIGYRNEF